MVAVWNYTKFMSIKAWCGAKKLFRVKYWTVWMLFHVQLVKINNGSYKKPKCHTGMLMFPSFCWVVVSVRFGCLLRKCNLFKSGILHSGKIKTFAYLLEATNKLVDKESSRMFNKVLFFCFYLVFQVQHESHVVYQTEKTNLINSVCIWLHINQWYYLI